MSTLPRSTDQCEAVETRNLYTVLKRLSNNYNEALPITNIFEPMAVMERELAAEKKRRVLAETAVTCCHSAMLGKVNPKHPAWGVVFAVQDAAWKADSTPNTDSANEVTK